MKKIVIALVLLLSLGAAQAQTVSKATVDQYRQLIKLHKKSYQTCNDQLAKWGFEYNKGGVMDIFVMQTHPYYRPEGQDTVGAMLGVIDGVVYSTSGLFSSNDVARAYSLIAGASAIQQQLATEMGLTKYVCSVKGKNVKNKFPKNHEELVEVLSEASAETVSMVYEEWKSADGKVTLTFVYNNHLYGKKKPRKNDRVELMLGLGTTPER